MTFTFEPDGSARNLVRSLIGDVIGDAVDTRLEDEEIDERLAARGNPTTEGAALYNAAADAAFALAARYSHKEVVGADKMGMPTRAEEMRATARELRTRAAQGGPIPYAGGLSFAEARTAHCNPDRIPSAFPRGFMENR